MQKLIFISRILLKASKYAWIRDKTTQMWIIKCYRNLKSADLISNLYFKIITLFKNY